MPAPNSDGDNTSDFPAFFASTMWPSLWPRLIQRYATTATRDADLAGLSAADRAFAWVDALACVTVWNGTVWRALSAVTTYTSVGGTAPVTVVSPAGSILQTLVVPAVAYARTLDVSMLAFVTSDTSADIWEAVGTWNSSDVTVNVTGRFRIVQWLTANIGGSGSFRSFVAQPAGSAITLRVWVRRLSGSGTGTGSVDHTYTNINVVALPA